MTTSTRGIEVRRVAEQLERQLGEERADAAGEVRRRAMPTPVLKNHTGSVGAVAGERDEPDQRGGEQRHADELADATGNGRSCHVRSP